MADNSKKVSELPVASNVASTDRVLVLRDPAGSPSVRTVTVNNFISNVASAIVANAAAQVNTSAATAYTNAVAYANSVLTSNLVNYVNTAQLAANLTSATINKTVNYVILTPWVANSTHEILLVDPNIAGANIEVQLPSSAANGKIYTVKCVNNGAVRKVFVSSNNSTVVENPNTHSFTANVDIANTGEVHSWVYYNSAYYSLS